MAEILTASLTALWGVLTEMAPYLLFGFIVAGVLSVFISPETVERQLGGRRLLPVLKAAVFGIPLPLCSCGVIPVTASLRRHGASRGAATAFLVSTPQTGVDSILVTYSMLGPVFAVLRPLAALAGGLAGGAVVALTEKRDARHTGTPDPRCTDDCCSTGRSGPRLARVFRYGLVTLPRDIGRALVLGLVAAAAISAAIPDEFFAGILGTGIGEKIVMMVVGMPVYVCATASVPVAAALIAKGISPGAALVFLMTGPATNAASFTTVWKIMGRRATLVYMTTVALTALASGVILDHLLIGRGVELSGQLTGMLPGYVKTASALALLVVLGAALVRRPGSVVIAPAKDEKGKEKEEMTLILKITGMTCSHCAHSVERALSECAGVEEAQVDLASGRAAVMGNADVRALVLAVEAAGYKASSMEG